MSTSTVPTSASQSFGAQLSSTGISEQAPVSVSSPAQVAPTGDMSGRTLTQVSASSGGAAEPLVIHTRGLSLILPSHFETPKSHVPNPAVESEKTAWEEFQKKCQSQSAGAVDLAAISIDFDDKN